MNVILKQIIRSPLCSCEIQASPLHADLLNLSCVRVIGFCILVVETLSTLLKIFQKLILLSDLLTDIDVLQQVPSSAMDIWGTCHVILFYLISLIVAYIYIYVYICTALSLAYLAVAVKERSDNSEVKPAANMTISAVLP